MSTEGSVVSSINVPAMMAEIKLLLPVPSPPVIQNRLSYVPNGTSLTDTTVLEISGGLL